MDTNHVKSVNRPVSFHLDNIDGGLGKTESTINGLPKGGNVFKDESSIETICETMRKNFF